MKIPPRVCTALYRSRARRVAPSHPPPPHDPKPLPPQFHPRGCFPRPAAPCQPPPPTPPPPPRQGVHVSGGLSRHKEPAGQKCGQRAEGRVFRLSVYCVLTALCIVEVNDRIPLCTGMKQLNEDSISPAVHTADELPRISRAHRVTRPRGRLSLHVAEGRQQKGPKGGTTNKGTVC